MPIDWKAYRDIILTGIISAICWAGFAYSVTTFQTQGGGAVFLIIAVVSLLRFGQLLDRRLEGVL